MARTFSPDVLRLAQDLGRPPEEIEHEAFKVKANTWRVRREVATDEQALEGVSLAAELAEACVERAVEDFLARGAKIPAVPPMRWGLRRAQNGDLV